MEVIKHGNTMSQMECPNCGCVFLYQRCDIKDAYERINAYESEKIGSYVKCPECGKVISILE